MRGFRGEFNTPKTFVCPVGKNFSAHSCQFSFLSFYFYKLLHRNVRFFPTTENREQTKVGLVSGLKGILAQNLVILNEKKGEREEIFSHQTNESQVTYWSSL